ncbi:hypothetical protein [Stutzerimonas nitrititolerans]|uniref:hypothetical protein n=1 Tax=Stutzerimonas nitrititolerans TaxID=2482751 RepID=UPI0028979569|nr:hypothetical protein [Stutzerimonas nitrititolerans]
MNASRLISFRYQIPVRDKRFFEFDAMEGVMKNQSRSVGPLVTASLLERARQRFRITKAGHPHDESRTMRDLLAQDGLDINGRPLGPQGSPLSAVAGPEVQPSKRCAAEPGATTDSPVLFDMEFSHRGAGGQLTRELVSVWVSDPEYFAGHCHLSHDHRLFAWDDIMGQVKLPDSGELLEVEEIRQRFV